MSGSRRGALGEGFAGVTIEDRDVRVTPSTMGVPTGTGAAAQVTYWSGADTITGSTGITFTVGTGQLALPTTGTSAGLMVGGDAQICRSAANRMLCNNTQLYASRSHGTVVGTAGILDIVNFSGSMASDGVGGNPSLRSLQFSVTVNGTNTIGDAQAVSGDVYVTGTAGNVIATASMSTNLRLTNAMTVSSGYGYRIAVILTGAGTVSTFRGVEARTPSRSSTGTITTNIGVDIQNQGIAAGTTATGINIQAQSGSSNNYALVSAAGNMHR